MDTNDWLYQPHIIEKIVHNTFLEDGPVRLNRLSDEEYMQIPFFRQISCLCEFIQNEGSVKLTATGNLPQRIVFKMYSLGIPFYYYEKYPHKLKKETDSESVHMARLLAEEAGLIKKRANSLSLTKLGERIIKDNFLFLKTLFITFGYKLSWGYFDGYEDPKIGQHGFGLSLMLVGRYGEEPRSSMFYSQKYFAAFPYLHNDRFRDRCYSWRTFERFMQNMGLVTFAEERKFTPEDVTIITRTELFGKLLSIDADFGKISFSSELNLPLYQLKICLKNSFPAIWREFHVPSDLSLSNLHLVIQTVMGWQNYHLHQFVKDGVFYTKRSVDDEYWDEMGSVDYNGLNISDLLKRENESILYEYDFGDGWVHNIELVKILNYDGSTDFLTCIAGERSCPPEDCGGIFRYKDILKILKDPAHEEYDEYITWLGDEFDPEVFSLNSVNNTLATFVRVN